MYWVWMIDYKESENKKPQSSVGGLFKGRPLKVKYDDKTATLEFEGKVYDLVMTARRDLRTGFRNVQSRYFVDVDDPKEYKIEVVLNPVDSTFEVEVLKLETEP